jgi:hypothetical protein
MKRREHPSPAQRTLYQIYFKGAAANCQEEFLECGYFFRDFYATSSNFPFQILR